MGMKDEELKSAKEVAVKFESELKEITLKHTSVNGPTSICSTFENLWVLSFVILKPISMHKTFTYCILNTSTELGRTKREQQVEVFH